MAQRPPACLVIEATAATKASPMPDRAHSWNQLEAEAWTSDPRITTSLARQHASIQSVRSGSGHYIFDEYSILVDSLPPGASVSSFLMEMAGDLNGTVNDTIFYSINRFAKAPTKPPQVGQIISIDIAGPDNGSVVVAVIDPEYFIFQTITTPADGTHPEYGSREFGIERVDGAMRLYTRGCSRTANALVGFVGAGPQMVGWTRLCRGLSDTIALRGGRPRSSSFMATKIDRKP
jgi:hypothetical protein